MRIAKCFKYTDLDKTYGLKNCMGDKIILGKKKIKFKNSELIFKVTPNPIILRIIRLIILKHRCHVTPNMV